jgi:hypothetical protein
MLDASFRWEATCAVSAEPQTESIVRRRGTTAEERKAAARRGGPTAVHADAGESQTRRRTIRLCLRRVEIIARRLDSALGSHFILDLFSSGIYKGLALFIKLDIHLGFSQVGVS